MSPMLNNTVIEKIDRSNSKKTSRTLHKSAS
jgi:hypothetical protein